MAQMAHFSSFKTEFRILNFGIRNSEFQIVKYYENEEMNHLGHRRGDTLYFPGKEYITCLHTVKILKFGTPQTIAIIVLKIEKFDVTFH